MKAKTAGLSDVPYLASSCGFLNVDTKYACLSELPNVLENASKDNIDSNKCIKHVGFGDERHPEREAEKISEKERCPPTSLYFRATAC